MTEHSLPDDLQRWPRDPFGLLGLDRGADFRQARRAYVQLIRRFKPDQFPEHFQRIRAAFEIVQRHIALRDAWRDTGANELSHDRELDWGGDAAENAVGAESHDEARHGADYGSTSRRPLEGRPAPAAASLADAAWKLARRGQLEKAYASLLSAREQQPHSAHLLVRLYWLLAAEPGLDAERQPADWLVEALRTSGLCGPAVELYRREVEYDRAHALAASAAGLLACRATPSRWLDILDCRWRALSYLQRWDRIVADLERLREHGYHLQDDAGWCRILFFAMDQLAWFTNHVPAQDAFERCRREVERASYLHASLDDCFDRMDLLFEVVLGWRRLRSASDVPRAWVNLVPLSWTQNFAVVRPHLIPLLKQIGEAPQAVLIALDHIASRSSAVASHLGAVLQHSRYEFGAFDRQQRPWDEVCNAARRFLAKFAGPYEQVRPDLLSFCLREALDPDRVGLAIDQMGILRDESGRSWADAISRDGSLRFVYAGWRAFWG